MARFTPALRRTSLLHAISIDMKIQLFMMTIAEINAEIRREELTVNL